MYADSILSSPMDEYVELAVRIAGGYRKVAADVGVSHNAVWKWAKKQAVPVKYCLAVSRSAKGLVAPRQLNPEYTESP